MRIKRSDKKITALASSKDNPIKNHKYKSGESGNPSRRPKGSLNRKTVAREYLAFLQEEVNPLTDIKRASK